MNTQYFIYGLVGIVLLYVAIKLLKWPIKILVNGIIGVITLYIVNLIGNNLGMLGLNFRFSLPINPLTALISGFFGIPGIIVIAIIIFLL